jgi:hypothetical protein
LIECCEKISNPTFEKQEMGKWFKKFADGSLDTIEHASFPIKLSKQESIAKEGTFQ